MDKHLHFLLHFAHLFYLLSYVVESNVAHISDINKFANILTTSECLCFLCNNKHLGNFLLIFLGNWSLWTHCLKIMHLLQLIYETHTGLHTHTHICMCTTSFGMRSAKHHIYLVKSDNIEKQEILEQVYRHLCKHFQILFSSL